MPKYSGWKTWKKVIKYGIIAFLSILAAGLMQQYPTIAQFNVFGGFTTYAILIALENYLKHRWNIKLS